MIAMHKLEAGTPQERLECERQRICQLAMSIVFLNVYDMSMT